MVWSSPAASSDPVPVVRQLTHSQNAFLQSSLQYRLSSPVIHVDIPVVSGLGLVIYVRRLCSFIYYNLAKFRLSAQCCRPDEIRSPSIFNLPNLYLQTLEAPGTRPPTLFLYAVRH